MAVMDEFKEERAALKNRPFKERLSYFWEYYKWYVIGIVCVVLFVGSFVHQIVTKKDTALYAVMLNASTLNPLDADDPYALEYAEYADIDLNEYDIFFDTSFHISESGMDQNSYTSLQKLSVYTAAADLDVMITDTDSFRRYAYSYTLHDLRNFLSPEKIAELEPYFYYVDQKVVDEIETANSKLDDTYVPVYADPTKPEEMETPIPVGIYLDGNAKLRENYYFRGEEGAAEHVVMGIFCNTKRSENVLKFLDFVFEEQVINLHIYGKSTAKSLPCFLHDHITC